MAWVVHRPLPAREGEEVDVPLGVAHRELVAGWVDGHGRDGSASRTNGHDGSIAVLPLFDDGHRAIAGADGGQAALHVEGDAEVEQHRRWGRQLGGAADLSGFAVVDPQLGFGQADDRPVVEPVAGEERLAPPEHTQVRAQVGEGSLEAAERVGARVAVVGLPSEQEGHIGIGLGQSGGIGHQTPGLGVEGTGGCPLLLLEGQHPGQDGDHGHDGDTGEKGPEATVGPAFGLLLGLASPGGGLDEVPLDRREVIAGSIGVGLGGLQTGASIQLSVRPPRRIPLATGLREVAEGPEVVAVVLQPGPQPGPLADQRLVGDFDGRFTRHRVTVEGQEPGPPELVDDGVDGGVVAEFGAEGPTSRVVGALAKRDQTSEDPPERHPTRFDR